MKRIPILLKYVCKSAIWGGTVLSNQWGRQGGADGVAESWELTVRPAEQSVIMNGEAEGMTLGAWIAAAGYDTVCPEYREGDRFPLLIKLIDAGDSLSVQVHPDDAFAASYEAETGDTGKTEMWYIVDAEKGASLVYGLKDGIGSEDFMAAAERGETESALRFVPVKAGECYFIPAGQVHAIGGGILIAEIQQNSNLTYRIYDFNRLSPDGTPRALHLDKAAAVIRNIPEEEIQAVRFARGGKEDPELLANCPYFKVRRLLVRNKDRLETVGKSFVSLLCIEGNGSLLHEGIEYPITKGNSYFLPAGMGDYLCRGEMTLICSEL